MKSLIRFLLLMTLPLAAMAVPNYINYQGRLLDNAGVPVGYPTPVNLPMVVTLWNSPTSTLPANILYQETQASVNVDDGVYAFQIGSGTPSAGYSWLPATLFNTSSPVYLELTIQGSTLSPRSELLSSPFTLQSGNSDNLGGQPISYFGTAGQISSLSAQLNSLNTQIINTCNASDTSKWSYNANFCFGGAPSKCKSGKFDKENFTGVVLNNADCTGATLTNVNFTGATFKGSTLLVGADLSGSNLAGAAFKSATNLTNATVKSITGIETVTWSLGVTCPDKYVLSKTGETCIGHGI